MFFSQVTTRDLFSTNPVHGHGARSDDSAVSSAQSHSQFEYSQASSQDFYSQQPGNSQQNESPRRPSFLQKNMMKENSSNKIPRTGTNSFGGSRQDYTDRRAVAKERDERDNYLTIVNMLKDCASEVKRTVSSIRDSNDDQAKVTQQNSVKLLEDVRQSLEKKFDEVIESLKKSQATEKAFQQLKEQLAKNDAVISEQKLIIQELKDEKEERIVEALKQTYNEHQLKMREQIHTYHKLQLDELIKQTDQNRNHQSILEKETAKQQLITRQQQHQLDDIKKRVDTELSGFEKYQSDLNENYQEQFKQVYTKQTTDLGKKLELKLMQTREDRIDKIENSLGEKMTKLLADQKSELEMTIRKLITSASQAQQQQHNDKIKSLSEKVASKGGQDHTMNTVSKSKDNLWATQKDSPLVIEISQSSTEDGDWFLNKKEDKSLADETPMCKPTRNDKCYSETAVGGYRMGLRSCNYKTEPICSNRKWTLPSTTKGILNTSWQVDKCKPSPVATVYPQVKCPATAPISTVQPQVTKQIRTANGKVQKRGRKPKKVVKKQKSPALDFIEKSIEMAKEDPSPSHGFLSPSSSILSPTISIGEVIRRRVRRTPVISGVDQSPVVEMSSKVFGRAFFTYGQPTWKSNTSRERRLLH